MMAINSSKTYTLETRLSGSDMKRIKINACATGFRTGFNSEDATR